MVCLASVLQISAFPNVVKRSYLVVKFHLRVLRRLDVLVVLYMLREGMGLGRYLIADQKE